MQMIGINTKKARNKVNNLIKYAKDRVYNNLEPTFSDFHKYDRKTFWQVIRHFVKNNNASNNIQPLSESKMAKPLTAFLMKKKLN